jgi:sugar O-acyltransferase (sialic acid O-acetyltransferase NeuD family)
MENQGKENNLIIVGAGNVGLFLAHNFDLFLDRYNIIGFVDDNIDKHNKSFAGLPVLGSINDLKNVSHGTAIALGIASPKLRQQIFDKIMKYPLVFPNMISKNSWISKEVELGIGAIIYPGVCINYGTEIGDFAIINMNCSIGHNVKLSDFCTLAPGVHLAGFTSLSECVEMGIGSATKQNINIGKNSLVGGQAMLVKDVPPHSLVIGVPGKATIRRTDS